MPLRLRKTLGAVSVFLLVSLSLDTILSGIFIFNDIGPLSISLGDLPSGNRIGFSLGFAVISFLSLLGGIQTGVVYFRLLSKQANDRRAALFAMLPVISLVVILCIIQWNVLVTMYSSN
jgi:hypothetical protein